MRYAVLRHGPPSRDSRSEANACCSDTGEAGSLAAVINSNHRHWYLQVHLRDTMQYSSLRGFLFNLRTGAEAVEVVGVRFHFQCAFERASIHAKETKKMVLRLLPFYSLLLFGIATRCLGNLALIYPPTMLPQVQRRFHNVIQTQHRKQRMGGRKNAVLSQK